MRERREDVRERRERRKRTVSVEGGTPRRRVKAVPVVFVVKSEGDGRFGASSRGVDPDRVLLRWRRGGSNGIDDGIGSLDMVRSGRVRGSGTVSVSVFTTRRVHTFSTECRGGRAVQTFSSAMRHGSSSVPSG